jgi:hypothetical protein
MLLNVYQTIWLHVSATTVFILTAVRTTNHHNCIHTYILWHDARRPKYRSQTRRPLVGIGSVNTFPRQRTRTPQRNCWERCILFGPCKAVTKKSSVKNRQSSSGVPSEQCVQIWALRERLGRWRYQFRCGVLTSTVKFVVRKRLMETVIDWGQ